MRHDLLENAAQRITESISILLEALSPFHKNLQLVQIKSAIASNKYADLSA
jgi:hypothetical protein